VVQQSTGIVRQTLQGTDIEWPALNGQAILLSPVTWALSMDNGCFAVGEFLLMFACLKAIAFRLWGEISANLFGGSALYLIVRQAALRK
jgi:hypothetical protein